MVRIARVKLLQSSRDEVLERCYHTVVENGIAVLGTWQLVLFFASNHQAMAKYERVA